MTYPEHDWRDSLFAHRSYWQLVRSELKTSAIAPKNIYVILLCTTLTVGGFATDSFLLNGSWAGGAEAVNFIRAWAANGIAFGSAMLAFLIAGFTVFATVTDVRVFHALAILTDKGRKGSNHRSHLQTIFVAFMLDFWHFLVFLLICVVLGFLFGQGTPATALLGYLTRDHQCLRNALVHFAVGVLGAYLLLLLLITKNFIWNVYQSVLIAIALKSTGINDQKG